MRVLGAVVMVGLVLSGCEAEKPRTVESIKASCDQEFGTDTEGSKRCQIDILAKDNAAGLRSLDEERKGREARAARNAGN